ncbi:MAG: DEAD/DEAH box helicase, partial [Kiritimatiellae bacterium]|nr:DEAD/DEAH box helicase [Kiritimatiellia bacterium]
RGRGRGRGAPEEDDGYRGPRPAAAPKTFPAPVVPESDWDPASYDVPEKPGSKRFTDFTLPIPLLHGIADLGFEYCTPIQAASLERTMAGDNVAGRAQTGTGKTAAFLIAIMKRMLENPETRPTVTGRPAALVLAPTRELVIQIVEDAKKLGKFCGFRSLAVYGGCDHEKQQDAIEAGPLDLIAATPGRLLDFRRAKVLDLSGVHTLVIDEADRMLDMGFIPDVRNIVRSVSPDRQTLLFSATLNEEVMRLAAQWMPNPVQIAVDDEFHPADTIVQMAWPISTHQKFTVLYNLLKKREGERVLVFRNRKSGCEQLVRELQSHDIPALELSGDVDQKKRIRILDDFRKGVAKIVVATDVAARGLQVDDISLVVNYDFPYEPDDYIHRIGRTGRAGETGTAISFACEDESFIIPDIEKLTGKELPCEMPDEEYFAEVPEATHSVPRREHHAPSGGRFGGRGHGGPRRGGPRRR